MPELRYAELLAAAEADGAVVGLVLGGSRGKGVHVQDESDYDVYLVVADRADEYRERFCSRRGDPVEVVVLSLEEFREHAALGSETEWNRYTFAHAAVVLDKLDGLIGRLAEEKGRLPPEAAREVAAEALDAYVNLYYRSLKNRPGERELEARLDAAESVPYLLTALFALHERVRPYNKYLRWELETHPLGGEPWEACGCCHGSKA